MSPVADKNYTNVADHVSPTLDLSRLLGFRDLTSVGTDEAELAAALDAIHVKIGEIPSPN
jgi:hypothetical protein